MLTDNFEDYGATPFTNVICRSGPTFPTHPLVGMLFVHDTHSLCVFGHDSQWRKVAR